MLSKVTNSDKISVVACNRLKDVEWITRQDPYVCVQYGNTKFKTRAHTDGGKQPNFQEKFLYSLIEGLREMDVSVMNSNNILRDNDICSGKVLLHKVISKGYDDSTSPLYTTSGRYAGEIRLILHYANAIDNHAGPSTPIYGQFAPPPPPPTSQYQYPSPYPHNPPPYPAYLYQYPPQVTPYPPQPYVYPPPPVYLGQPYPQAPQANAYYPPPAGTYYGPPYNNNF